MPDAPKPAGPKTVKVTVDGQVAEVPAGLNLIEVARRLGIEIPHYCYHPKLSIAANCRMCLVEVSNAPRLVPACQAVAADNLGVKTTTPRVKEEQRAVLEFLLLNHPVDCAICDQAGECKLQDFYMAYDAKPSRLEGEKVLRDKRKVLGPLVVLDQERCILCTRCVRFMAEVARSPQLGVFNRGSHEVIDVFPGKPLDSKYAGNTVDICPVGALLSRDFRFKARAFFLSTTPSVCTGCERGCSTWLDHYDGTAYRYRPRENPAVNDGWMCDEGRAGYKYLSAGRLLAPRVGAGESARTLPASAAVSEAAAKLRPHAGAGLAVLVSPLASVEDQLAGLHVAREALRATAVFAGGRAAGVGDEFLIRPDKNPNRTSLGWIAGALGLKVLPYHEFVSALAKRALKAVYAIGAEVPDDPARAAASLSFVEAAIVQAFNDGPIAAAAAVALPASPHSEEDGTFVNFLGHVQRFARAYPPRGQSAPHWRWAARLGEALGLACGWSSAREVFADLAPRVPELKEFRWDSLPPGTRPKGRQAIPAAADGRPAGYREIA